MTNCGVGRVTRARQNLDFRQTESGFLRKLDKCNSLDRVRAVDAPALGARRSGKQSRFFVIADGRRPQTALTGDFSNCHKKVLDFKFT